MSKSSNKSFDTDHIVQCSGWAGLSICSSGDGAKTKYPEEKVQEERKGVDQQGKLTVTSAQCLTLS